MYPSLSALANFMGLSTPPSPLANTKKDIQECAVLEPHHRSLITDSQGNQDVQWPIERMAALAVDEFHQRRSEQKTWTARLSTAGNYKRSEPVQAIDGMQKLLGKKKVTGDSRLIGDNEQILRQAAQTGSDRLFELLLEHGAKPSPEVGATLQKDAYSQAEKDYNQASQADKPMMAEMMNNIIRMNKLNRTYAKARRFIEKLRWRDDEMPRIQEIKRRLKDIVKANPEDRIGIVNSKGDYKEHYPIEAVAHFAEEEFFERAKDMHTALENPARLEPVHSIEAMQEVLKKEVPMIVQLAPQEALQKVAKTGSEPLFSLLLEHHIVPEPEEIDSLLDDACFYGRQNLKDLEKCRPSGSTSSSPEAWKKWIDDLGMRLDKKIERMKQMPKEHEEEMNRQSIANEESLLAQIENERKIETEKSAAPGTSKSAKRKARRKAAAEEKSQPPRQDNASNPLRVDELPPSISLNPFAPLMELQNPSASASTDQKKSQQWRKVQASAPLPAKPEMSASRMADATASGEAEPSAKPERTAMTKKSSGPLKESGVSNAPRLNEPLSAKEEMGAASKGKEASPFRPAEKPAVLPKIKKTEKAASASQAGKGKAREQKKQIWRMVVHQQDNPSTTITMGDPSSRRRRPVARPQQQAPAAVSQSMPELTDTDAFPELRASQNGMESPMSLAENNPILEKLRSINWDAITEPFPLPRQMAALNAFEVLMQKRWKEAMRLSEVEDSGVVIYSSENA